MIKAFLLIAILIYSQNQFSYIKLKCDSKPADPTCFTEIYDGHNNGYIATVTYTPSTPVGLSVNFRKYCEVSESESLRHGTLKNKKLDGAKCTYGDECFSGVCNKHKNVCALAIKNDITTCAANSDCASHLICNKTTQTCTLPKKAGEACSLDADAPCTPDCFCHKNICTKYASIEVSQPSDSEMFCKSQCLDDKGMCCDRTKLPKLKTEIGKNYKTCSIFTDCEYDPPLSGSHVDMCQYPAVSPYLTGNPIKYCKYGGGEQILIDGISKYIADLKYEDFVLNAYNKRMFDDLERINFINIVPCSPMAYEISYKPKPVTPFPWLWVIIVGLALIPLIIIPIALICA